MCVVSWDAEAAGAGCRPGNLTALLLRVSPVPLPRLWRARIGRQLWPHLQHRVAAVEAPLLTEEAEEAYQRQEEAGLMSWRQVKAVSSAIHSTPVETSSPEGAPPPVQPC